MPGMLTEATDQLDPIHHRHVPVDGDEVRPRCGREPLERLGTVGGLITVESQIAQRFCHDRPACLGVIYDQRPHVKDLLSAPRHGCCSAYRL